MIEEMDVDKFKQLMKDLYKSFPNGMVREEVEQIVVMQSVRDHLVDEKFLLKETYGDGGQSRDYYMLGPSSLSLLSFWETEELTKSIKKLTWAIVLMTAISLLLFIIQTLRIFGVI